MNDESQRYRLDRDLIVERVGDSEYAWHRLGRRQAVALEEVVERARIVLRRTRDDLAVIDYHIAQERNRDRQNLHLDKRKRRQDAERFLADFLGWAAQRAV